MHPESLAEWSVANRQPAMQDREVISVYKSAEPKGESNTSVSSDLARAYLVLPIAVPTRRQIRARANKECKSPPSGTGADDRSHKLVFLDSGIEIQQLRWGSFTGGQTYL